MRKVWEWLKGKKTYIVAFTLVLYAVARWWAGEIDADTALRLVLEGLGLGSLRHGLQTLLEVLEVKSEK